MSQVQINLIQLLYVVLPVLLTASAIAQSHADIAASKDKTLFEDSTGMLSNGAEPNLFVGKNNLGEVRRGVIAFDVAANVPPERSSTASVSHSTCRKQWRAEADDLFGEWKSRGLLMKPFPQSCVHRHMDRWRCATHQVIGRPIPDHLSPWQSQG